MIAKINTLAWILRHPLCRGRKKEAFVNYIKWNIGVRFAPGPIVTPFISNLKILSSRTMQGAKANVYTGLVEFEDMSFAIHFCSQNDMFIDVGANVGAFSILVAGLNGCKVTSFEPSPKTFQILRSNLRLNELDGLVDVINSGVGDRVSTIKFSKVNDTVNHVLHASETNSEFDEVSICSLDSVFTETRALAEKDICIKIDVEGYEYFVLKGAKNLLAMQKVLAILIELNDSGRRYGISDHSIVEILISGGFSPYSYDPFSRRLSKIVGKNSNLPGTIFLRESSYEYIQQKIAKAKPFRIFRYLI